MASRGKNLASLLLLAVLVFLSAQPGRVWGHDPLIAACIRSRLDNASSSGELMLGSEQVHASRSLIPFYQERDFRPVWVKRGGIIDSGWELPGFLEKMKDHGLDPEDYHLSCIKGLLEKLDLAQSWDSQSFSADPDMLARVDILLSDGFLCSLSHLSAGKVSAKTLDTQWLAPEKKAGLLLQLKHLGSGLEGTALFSKFLPSCRNYKSLLKAGISLRRRVEQGGWNPIPKGPLLRKGDTGPRVQALRQRLEPFRAAQPESAGARGIFDLRLEDAVKEFQRCHGLKDDGLVGEATLAALNVPAGTRWETVMLNLERLRWLSCFLGERYVLVNPADFTLQAYENQKMQFSLRVVVGKKFHKTPVFREELRYIVLNPYWNVPRSIAVKEILPKVKQDPRYLSRARYQLLSGWGEEKIVDPLGIDWKEVTPENFEWRIRQDPGPWNSLGQLKFVFPNAYHVYIHDTPDKHLFKEQVRAFSHGCIRLEHPIRLAAFVLQDDPGWTAKRIRKILKSGERKTISLTRTCPVYLIYATAWVDEQGRVQFRRDVYDRDQALWEALAKTN